MELHVASIQEWEIISATVLSERDQRRQEAAGWGTISLVSGFDLLEQLLENRVTHAAVLPLDWVKYARTLPDGAIPGFLTKLAGSISEGVSTGALEPRRNIPDLLREAPAGARGELLSDYVKSEVASLLGLNDGASLEPREGFAEMGMDSLNECRAPQPAPEWTRNQTVFDICVRLLQCRRRHRVSLRSVVLG